MVLDPFAGVGTLFSAFPNGVGVEIEPEWATQNPRNIIGDALNLPFVNGSFMWAATSPTYGNRMADHHEAKDNSKRYTYRHFLGRMPTKGSSSVMQWGSDYEEFHFRAWKNVYDMLGYGGKFFCNVKNHIRSFEVMDAESLHIGLLRDVGFSVVEVVNVEARGLRHGENHAARVDQEVILCLEKT